MTVLSRDATAEPDEPDDAVLIERSRADDASAYEVLYERHAESARRLARRLSRDRDRAEDLVAEAFTRVLAALRRGNGPDLAFRPYLLTVVRNIAIEWANGDKRVLLVDGYEALERPTAEDDPVIAGVERGLAARAFAELPERWQAVLWHTEVEGESPAGIAPLLGLSPNAVAALAVRAREGLRQGYLQAHLSGDIPDDCRDHADGLARFTRGRLMRRKSAALREHLDNCARCSALYAELVQANTGLGALIGAAVLGPIAAAYGWTGASGISLGGAGVWLARLRPRGSTGTAVAAGAAAVVVAAGVFAGIRLTSAPTHREAAPAAQGAHPGQANANNNANKPGKPGGGNPPAAKPKPKPKQHPPAATTPQSRPRPPASTPASTPPSSAPASPPPSHAPPSRPAPDPHTSAPAPSDPPSTPAPRPSLPTAPPTVTPSPTCTWYDPGCWVPGDGKPPWARGTPH